HALAGRDDAEAVVHLYEERGLQCVKALRGAFALALWDEGRQRLVLARDQLGLVPLYYAADGGTLAVASALPALLRLPHAAGTWDPAALDAFVALGSVAPPMTFYTGIRQLAPGELAIWEDGRLRTQRYWQLTFPERRMARPDVPAALHLAARRARTDVGVGLAGVGGEEVFGGSLPVRLAERMRRYRGLPGLAREAVQLWARVGRGGKAAELRRLVDEERLAPFELYSRAV